MFKVGTKTSTFLNGSTSASFLFIFSLFKQTVQILQQINVKKCPSSIWRWDSNAQPSDYESSLDQGSRPKEFQLKSSLSVTKKVRLPRAVM